MFGIPLFSLFWKSSSFLSCSRGSSCSLKLDSLNFDSLELDSLKLDSLKLDSLKLDSLKLDSRILSYMTSPNLCANAI